MHANQPSAGRKEKSHQRLKLGKRKEKNQSYQLDAQGGSPDFQNFQ